jgi:CubicO group peptidase (beta-lactamase class C family)
MLLFATGLFAVPTEEAPAEEVAAAPESIGPSDPEELEAFIDGMMAAHMPSRNIPAATISIVKDGELFFAKGYGFADREEKIPVVANKTLFRPGSTSKLFTWTAVMQLAERGQLDLDADINDYLTAFKIPATYPEPITMKHLLTHTPGFEDGGMGYLIIKDESGLMPMREALAAHIPERVRPPGTWASYSNFGTALAGLIVEEITGLPFPDYIEQNIFQPLGMESSTFHEPLPEHLAPNMAVSYRRSNGLYKPESFEFISNFGPAGALSSTATDMARFMIAHLQLGRFGEQRILEEETAREMHSLIYTPDPRMPGMAYGFYESDVLGHRIIGHGGDTVYFHTDLALLTEQNVGLFVSYATNGGQARGQLVEAFVRRYFDVTERDLPEPPEDFAKRWKKLAGTYRGTRHNYSQLEKLMALPSVVKVGISPEGTLFTSGLLGPEPWHWMEVEPLYFRQVDGDLSLAFHEDENGNVTHLFLSMVPPATQAYRIPFYAAPTFNYILLVAGIVLFVTTLVAAVRHRKARKEDPAGARWAVRLAVAVSTLTLLFLVSAAVIISMFEMELFFEGIPASLTAALVLPILTSILTIGVVWSAVLVWKDGWWTRFRRIHYSLFAVAAVGYVWFYWYWNVLGFQY